MKELVQSTQLNLFISVRKKKVILLIWKQIGCCITNHMGWEMLRLHCAHISSSKCKTNPLNTQVTLTFVLIRPFWIILLLRSCQRDETHTSPNLHLINHHLVCTVPFIPTLPGQLQTLCSYKGIEVEQLVWRLLIFRAMSEVLGQRARVGKKGSKGETLWSPTILE